MNRCIRSLLGAMLAALLIAAIANHGADSAPDRRRLDGPAALEGRAVNGLRLEVTAKFLPEEDGWGAPCLERMVIFHNESDATICLDGYFYYERLVLSHVTPAKFLQEQQTHIAPNGCRPGVQDWHVIRIPPRQKHHFKFVHKCDSFTIPFGRLTNGKLVDDKQFQVLDLIRTGELTLGYVYRSDDPQGVSHELQPFLGPGEKLWTGRVYSNLTTIHVSKLRHREMK